MCEIVTKVNKVFLYDILYIMSDISNRIMEKLEENVHDKKKLEMIVDLLKKEKRYAHNERDCNEVIKREFQLLLDQHFPFSSDKND